MTTGTTRTRPPFSSLPLDKSGPPGNAWGLYGTDDELGALNLITPQTVKLAAQEISLGERVSLDWSLDLPSHPSFNRPPLKWRLHNKAPRTVNDDFLDFNTQGSSQWDGLRHYGYQKAKLFYNNTSQATLEQTGKLGIDRVASTGGITTRGVILDYPRYQEKKGKAPVSALQAASISAEELKEMVQLSDVQPREGDLLLLRTGYTRDYERLGTEERVAMGEPGKEARYLGVESSKSVLEWIWESGFVGVAGDAPSFEMSPLVGPHNAPGGIWKGESWEDEMQGGGLIHQWCLAGWGVMIGEMWDLEALCDKAEQLGRYTCFVSSVPLKVPCGVASPPNAVAIF